MSQDIPTIQADVREKLGTRFTQRLRAAGKLPAVVYGHGEDPVHVVFDTKLFNEAVHTGSHLYEISVGGKTQHCLLKSVQWDHLSRHIIHADLTRVDLSETVTAEVRLEWVGEPKAAQVTGQSLDHPINEVTVECRADQIPDAIQVDIANLEADAPMQVSDLTAPAGVKIVSDPEGIVANIIAIKAVEEPTDGEASTDGEPEVIDKGKEEDGGDA